MRDTIDKIISNFNKYYRSRFKINKIFKKNDMIIISIDTEGKLVDGYFLYETPRLIRAITPTLNPDKFIDIVREENLIYSTEETNE